MPFTVFVGNYKILVNSTKNAFVEFCDEFNVSGIKKENVSRCCSRPLTGDSFIIVRKDSGPLRLFEVFLSGMIIQKYIVSGIGTLLSWFLVYMSSWLYTSFDAQQNILT